MLHLITGDSNLAGAQIAFDQQGYSNIWQTSIPEGYAKLLSNWSQIWVITDDDWNLAVQLACLQSYEQIIQAMI